MTNAVKLGYFNSGATAGVQVGPVGPRGLYGVISTVTGGAVTIYDGTDTTGTILFTKTLVVGDVISILGHHGIAANKGLFLVTAGTVNIVYT